MGGVRGRTNGAAQPLRRQQAVGVRERAGGRGAVLAAAARVRVRRPCVCVCMRVLLLQLQSSVGQRSQMRVASRRRHAGPMAGGAAGARAGGRERRREEVGGVGRADRRGMVTGCASLTATMSLAVAARQGAHRSHAQQRAHVARALGQVRHASRKRNGRAGTDGGGDGVDRGAYGRMARGRPRRCSRAATALRRGWAPAAARSRVRG